MSEFQVTLAIPPASTGIGEARTFTRNQLDYWGLGELVDTTLLMVSELVTNALLHAGEGAELTLMLSASRLRAEVRDCSPSIPVVRNFSDTATTGRGMVIVDALAKEWGTFAAGEGKVVWFELDAGEHIRGIIARSKGSSIPSGSPKASTSRPKTRSAGGRNGDGPSASVLDLAGAGSGR